MLLRPSEPSVASPNAGRSCLLTLRSGQLHTLTAFQVFSFAFRNNALPNDSWARYTVVRRLVQVRRLLEARPDMVSSDLERKPTKALSVSQPRSRPLARPAILCLLTTAATAMAGAQQIAIQSQANGSYIQTNNQGAIAASAANVKASAEFERLYLSNGFFALRNVSSGLYLSVDTTSYLVSDTAISIGLAEQFSAAVQTSGATALLSRAAQQYVSLQAPGKTLAALATSVGTDESFTITETDPSESIVGTMNAGIKHQSITGFGGAEVFYNNYLTANPYSAEIYQALFDPIQGLGINLLRLDNIYDVNGTTTNFDPTSQTIVQNASSYLGQAPTILMSAWTPPAYLKSNDNTTGGTLRKVNGSYDYTGYAQWWADSIKAYRGIGIDPTYVSIQNEPDAVVGYVSMSLNPSEKLYNGNEYAGYNKALSAVKGQIFALASPPTLIGPETQGIGYNTFQDYVNALNASDLGVIAEHLYTGGSLSQPDSFDPNLEAIDQQFSKKPKFDTEYYGSPAFDYAWLISNALVAEGTSAYLYWALAWPDNQQGLIYLDNPYNSPTTWEQPHGWAVNDQYYAMKHFSYFIHPGYTRVDGVVNDPDLRFSAFVDETSKAAVAVAINTSTTRTITFGLAATGLTIDNTRAYRSTFSGTERWASLGELEAGNTVSLPPQSVATIALNQY